MRSKLFVLTLILILAVGAVSAQITDPTIPDELPEGIEITYWHEWDGAQQVGIDAVIDAFEASNEYGITVNQVQLGSTGPLLEQVSTGIVSGELPNLVGATFVDVAQGWWLDGVLVPLDAYYNHPEWGFTEEELALFNQDFLDINRPGGPFEGRLLAWPIGVSMNVMSTNLEMLESLDLSFEGAPTTLEQFREAACAANELTSPDGGDVQGFPIRTSASDLYSFLAANGAEYYDAETNTYNFTSPEAIEVLQFFADLFADGCAYLPDGPFVNTADFAFGLNPFAVGSSVGVPFIKGDIEESGSGIENWINTTVPWSEGNRILQAGMRGVGLLDSTHEENLATWEFIKFMASTEAQVVWTENAQYVPYNTAALEELGEEFLTENPQFASVREALLDPEINVVSIPQVLGSDDAEEAVEEMIVAITVGGEDVAEAAAEAEELANEAVAEGAEALE